MLVELITKFEDLRSDTQLYIQLLVSSGSMSADPGPQFLVKYHHILRCEKKDWVFKDLPRVPTLVDCRKKW